MKSHPMPNFWRYEEKNECVWPYSSFMESILSPLLHRPNTAELMAAIPDEKASPYFTLSRDAYLDSSACVVGLPHRVYRKGSPLLMSIYGSALLFGDMNVAVSNIGVTTFPKRSSIISPACTALVLKPSP